MAQDSTRAPHGDKLGFYPPCTEIPPDVELRCPHQGVFYGTSVVFPVQSGNVCRMRPIHLFPSAKGWMRKTDSRINICGSAYVRHASVKLHLGIVFEIRKALIVNKRNIFFYKLYDKGRNPILRAFWWSFAKIKVVIIIFRHNPMRCT